jgi:hypothetical protein
VQTSSKKSINLKQRKSMTIHNVCEEYLQLWLPIYLRAKETVKAKKKLTSQKGQSLHQTAQLLLLYRFSTTWSLVILVATI